MLNWLEGFETYSTGDISSPLLKRWIGDSVISGLDTSTGRSVGSSLRLDPGSSTGYITSWTFPNISTGFIGFGYKVGTLDDGKIMSFNDALDEQFSLYCNADGTLSILKGVSVIGTTIGNITADTWAYIEVGFELVCDCGNNNVIVRLDGETDLVLENVNIQTTENSWINNITLHTLGSQYTYFDDIYCCDDTGERNNSFLGDSKIVGISPNAIGNCNNWTPVGESDNWECTDETDPDNTTTYVYSNNVGDKDTYNFTNPTIPSLTTIKGIEIRYYARDLVSPHLLTPIVRTGGIDYNGTKFTVTEDDWHYYHNISEENPLTLDDWTSSELNSAEFGMKY